METLFINNLQKFVNADSRNNQTSTAPCTSAIDHYKYYQFCLIPALLITMAFAATKKRRNILLNMFSGRPGLIYPMDSLTRSSTISYACAFGATAILVYRIVLDQTYAIEYKGAGAVKSFIVIASMFIYGMVFFPVFGSLALKTVFSFGLGTAYVWMMIAIDIFKLAECQVDPKYRVLLVLRGLPSLLCLLYLSISMPIRMVTAFKQGKYFFWDEVEEGEENSMEDIRDSYSGHHVAKLFRKPVLKLPPEGLKQRVANLVIGLFHRFVYQRQRGFRYPSKMISVMFVALIVIYTMTLEIMALFPPMIQLYGEDLLYQMDNTIASSPAANESSDDTDLRKALYFGYRVLGILRVCLIVSTVLATVSSLFNVLHTLSSYRQNLYALYRGDHSHIPPASAYSNASHCVNSIKYAGFQVGYIIWSYVLQGLILFLLTFVLAIVILLIMNDVNKWIILLLELLWPVVLTAVIVALVQLLLAKYFFLQGRGVYLALNNRSFYFNFTYFMFFYNIFLGLVSCLLRILKAMFLGIVFLSRLDNSTLPRRFEFIDPGFKAYVGYMQIEAAHTHPVVIIFTRVMMLGLQHKRERVRAQEGKLNAEGTTQLNEAKEGATQLNAAKEGVTQLNAAKEGATQLNGSHCASNEMQLKTREKSVQRDDDVIIQVSVSERVYKSEEERRRREAARFNWHVMYTLLHNPDIRVMRKGYLQMLRQARLFGVHIAVSDRQADINFDKLQQDITDAREKYNPTAKKSKDKAYDDDAHNDDVTETEMVDVEAGKGDVKKTSVVVLTKTWTHDELDVSVTEITHC
ncbi:receptor for retinol uptake stra6-like [Littorina saxatilis]|uniref:receptor for retinol uptake stra6-like n=1 Tax=Littorina saxatilis TaxID=31220 RepID=UPI0038B52976